MNRLWPMLLVAYDVLMPRFITEDVACLEGPNGVFPVCPVQQAYPDETFDFVLRIRCFNLFGLALFSKPVGDLRPWAER